MSKHKRFQHSEFSLKHYEVKTSRFCDKYSLFFFTKETVLRNHRVDLVDLKLLHWLHELGAWTLRMRGDMIFQRVVVLVGGGGGVLFVF